MKSNKNSNEYKSMHHQLALNQWYQSPLGHYLIEQIKSRLDSVLSTSFGYYAVQLGAENLSAELMQNCRINHVFRMGQSLAGEHQAQDVLIDAKSLPVASDSIDMVILMHAISQAQDPHAILREVNRVLIPDGKLIIIDFNPVSLWGLRHLLQAWLDEAPWAGHYYTASRLKDWANLLGFEQLHHYKCGYVLPFNYAELISRSRIFSKFSERWLKFSSALNIMVFEKNTIPLTPIRKRWVKRQILSPNIVRPTVGRGMNMTKTKYDK
ncbi:MAG: methyltransferase domain-containing protein [Gammaproteobacteria bacterium]|nr:methyltransferase domain-containing protein [Gammaproteobacteria bacterium]